MKILGLIISGFLVLLVIFILFILLNILLFSGYLYIAILIAIILIVFIVFLLKNKSFKKNKKDYIVLSIVFIIFFSYLFSYTYFSYTKYNGNILDDKINLLNSDNYKLSTVEEYNICLKDGCDILKLYSDDIIKIEKLLIGNTKDIDAINILFELKKIVNKKELLIKNGYIVDNKISFNKEIFIENMIKKEYVKYDTFFDGIYKNIFINEKGFQEYRKNIIYFSYYNIINNNINSNVFDNSEFSIDSNTRVWHFIINRRYIYNTLFDTLNQMKYLAGSLDNIELLIEKININQ